MACVLKATLSRASTKPRWVITAYAIFFGGVLLLGGALTSGLNWSWIFFLNVPIGVLLIGVSPGPAAGNLRRPAPSAPRHRWRGLDYPAAAAATPRHRDPRHPAASAMTRASHSSSRGRHVGRMGVAQPDRCPAPDAGTVRRRGRPLSFRSRRRPHLRQPPRPILLDLTCHRLHTNVQCCRLPCAACGR